MKRYIILLIFIYLLIVLMIHINNKQKNIESIKYFHLNTSNNLDNNSNSFNYEYFDIYIPNIGLYGSISKDQSKNIWIDRIYKIDDKQQIIIPGHRLPSTISTLSFYNLDKLKLGDLIIIYDKDNNIYEKYEIYKIKDSELSSAKDYLDILYNKEIILYTCTPHITYHRRLIIKARIQKRGISASIR